MSFYIVQTMSCGPLTEVQYVRRADTERPSRLDLQRFTDHARRNYAALRNVPLAQVMPGKMALRRRTIIGIRAVELDD